MTRELRDLLEAIRHHLAVNSGRVPENRMYIDLIDEAIAKTGRPVGWDNVAKQPIGALVREESATDAEVRASEGGGKIIDLMDELQKSLRGGA